MSGGEGRGNPPVGSLPEIHGKFDGTQNALNGPEGDEKGGGKGEALNRVARSGT